MPLPVPIRCTNHEGHQNPHFVLLKLATTNGVRDLQIAWSEGPTEEEAKAFPRIMGVPLAPINVRASDMWEN